MEQLIQLLAREFRAFKTEILDRIASLEAAVQAAAAPSADPAIGADATQQATTDTKAPPAKDTTKAGA